MTLASTVNLNATTPSPASGKQNIVFADDSGSPTVNVTATDPNLVGDSGSGGLAGNAPAPGAGDAAAGKFLKADGTWAVPAGGFSNPMTTEGDLIYGGASGTPTRLAAGSSGDVLQTNGSGSAPTWVPPGSNATGVIHSGSGAPSQGTAATITHVQAASGSGGSLAFGSNVTAGDLLLVIEVGESGMTDALQPTDTVGTDYVLLGYAAGSGTVVFALWGGIAPASGANTVTWSSGGVTNPTMGVEEFANATPLIDVSMSTQFNAANPSVSITPNLSGDLLYAVAAYLWANGTGLSYTAGSGFTLGSTLVGSGINNPFAGEYLDGGSTSPTTVALSQTGNTGVRAAFGALALLARHTGSVGNDGDFYLDATSGKLYGPRQFGIYSPVGEGLGLVTADGTTVTESDGVLSASGGGGGGAVTLLASQLISSAVPSVMFTGLSGSYSHLKIVIVGQTDNGSNQPVRAVFNTDTGANYDFSVVDAHPSNSFGCSGFNGQAAMFLGVLESSSGTSKPGLVEAIVGAYAGSTFYKQVQSHNSFWNGSNNESQDVFGSWNSTAAIDEIELVLDAGNFVVGSLISIYAFE